MAQVMTRGMVKSRFIIQWAIRIQVPDIYFAPSVALLVRFLIISGMQFID